MGNRNKSSMDYTSLGCCALAFILYMNTLNAGFVYDDRRAVLGNADVSNTNSWIQMFQHDYWGTPLADSGSHGSYRPLSVLSFKMNYLIGGYNPWGYHLINNLMHCLATGLVVKLARHFLTSIWGIIATGALFAAHPIHTEAVAGIVGRADLAACIFYLLTYLTFMKHMIWREKDDVKQWLALSLTIILSVLALLFKETAITALVVCALFDIIRGFCGFSDKNRYRTLSIIVIALVTILYFRLTVPGSKGGNFSAADNPIAKTNSTWTRFLTFLYLPVFNFKLLVYPSVLSFDWGMDAIPRINTIYDSRNLLSICFYLTMITTIWQSVRVLKKHKDFSYDIKKQRKSRSKKKICIMQYNTDNTQIIETNQNNKIITKLITKNDCVCRICKQEVSVRHTSSCRTINNNNVPGPLVECGCIFEQHRSTHQNSLLSSLSLSSSSTSSLSSSLSSSSIFLLRDHAKLKTSSFLTTSNVTSAFECITNTMKHNSNKFGNGCCRKNSITNNTNSNSKNSICNSGKFLLRNLPPSTINGIVLIMSIAFLTFPFVPATNLFFYVGFVVAERLLYIPSVGYCLFVGFGIGKIMEPLQHPKKKIAVILCMSLILSMLGVKTWKRNFDWKDDESLYKSAVGINPPKALGNLGSVLSSQGRYLEAKEILLEALKYRPNMADVYFNLGSLHQNQQNFQSAIEYFQKAIQFRPSLALAYLNLGTSLIALGRCKEAAKILKEGTKVDGTGVRDRTAHENARLSSYLQLGNLYAEQGKLQRALAIYREALYSLPENYQTEVLYYRIGDIFNRLQQWDKAEKYHRKALDIQPNHVQAHLSYGIVLAKNSSRISEAEEWFKRALKLAPTQATVYHHYAEFLSSHSRDAEACIYRIRAAELSSNDYSLVVSAATALRLLDRKIEAEIWYRKAVQLRPDDARAHTNLGAILHLLGQTEKAAASYKEALRLQPGDPTTLGNLAKLGALDAQ